jgi:AraC family transcriptional regulator
MNFWPAMSWHTEGIEVVAPVKWRQFDGLMGAFWQAESHRGAKAYYLADDPRVMIFFEDVSSKVAISNDGDAATASARPMARAVYIPPGVPLWTTTSVVHRFSHLNLHVHQDRLLRFLSPSIGRSSALLALRRPVEVPMDSGIEALAQLIVAELVEPARPAVFAESLVGALFAGLLDIPEQGTPRDQGRLTTAQMKKLTAHVSSSGSHRLSVGDMAACVGLSESWFSSAFRQTTGQSPLQWQLHRRIGLVKDLLETGELTVAEIAARLGFTDQAHLTRMFRQVTGDTPAAWRRLRHRE